MCWCTCPPPASMYSRSSNVGYQNLLPEVLPRLCSTHRVLAGSLMLVGSTDMGVEGVSLRCSLRLSMPLVSASVSICGHVSASVSWAQQRHSKLRSKFFDVAGGSGSHGSRSSGNG